MGLNEISEWIYYKSRELTKWRTCPQRYGIEQLCIQASRQLTEGSRLLDAGAGDCYYARYFPQAEYISMDFAKCGYSYSNIDIIGDVMDIPLRDNSVDAILCLDVLEHMPEPLAMLNEFWRILKPGGQLFLSVPQAWPLHGEPYDFYRYTSYGLEYLFKKAGFDVIFIEPIGGLFWFLASIMAPAALRGIKNRVLKLPSVILFGVIMPFLFFYLDRFDKSRKMTIGYKCYCRK